MPIRPWVRIEPLDVISYKVVEFAGQGRDEIDIANHRKDWIIGVTSNVKQIYFCLRVLGDVINQRSSRFRHPRPTRVLAFAI